MAQKKLTQKEWDQAHDLSDELMTLIVSEGMSVGVSLIAVTFLMAKALLSLSDNTRSKHTPILMMRLFPT
jgi:hypothetical protein